MTPRFTRAILYSYSFVENLARMLVTIRHRHGNHALIAIIHQLKLVELLQQTAGLAAAKMAFAALRLYRLTAASKAEALHRTLVRLHLRHELFLFIICIVICI